MTGKEKCEVLRQIRREIAKANDIEIETRECTHKGECQGTCPWCESEVRALAAKLEKRRALRKKVVLAGVSVGIAAMMSGCAVIDGIKNIDFGSRTDGMIAPVTTPEPETTVELAGEIEYIEPETGNPQP